MGAPGGKPPGELDVAGGDFGGNGCGGGGGVGPLLGAKITGGGGGGTVCVLGLNCAEAEGAVLRVQEEYSKRLGKAVKVFEGSSDGLFGSGFWEMTMKGF